MQDSDQGYFLCLLRKFERLQVIIGVIVVTALAVVDIGDGVGQLQHVI